MVCNCDAACSHFVQLRQGESSDRSTLIESITLDGLTKGDLLTATVSIDVDGKIHFAVYTIHGAVMFVVLCGPWCCVLYGGMGVELVAWDVLYCL